MSWLVNIDAVPAGSSLYTVFASWPDDEATEELDIIASSTASVDELLALAQAQLDEGYLPGAKIVGIVNQSDGFIMLDRRADDHDD